MMKKKIFPVYLLLVILLVPLLVSACGSDTITAPLGQEFTLPAGKTATISGESLSIKFVEVTGDSRCPTGVQCIVAGDAKCLMLINYSNSQSSLTFTQQGGNDTNTVDFNVFKITFQLQPYPVYGEEIKAADYKLIMMVTKPVK
jgi:hypothetical protein